VRPCAAHWPLLGSPPPSAPRLGPSTRAQRHTLAMRMLYSLFSPSLPALASLSSASSFWMVSSPAWTCRAAGGRSSQFGAGGVAGDEGRGAVVHLTPGPQGSRDLALGSCNHRGAHGPAAALWLCRSGASPAAPADRAPLARGARACAPPGRHLRGGRPPAGRAARRPRGGLHSPAPDPTPAGPAERCCMPAAHLRWWPLPAFTNPRPWPGRRRWLGTTTARRRPAGRAPSPPLPPRPAPPPRPPRPHLFLQGGRLGLH
jgi:hypothetical protein